jgi:hypothetical protein
MGGAPYFCAGFSSVQDGATCRRRLDNSGKKLIGALSRLKGAARSFLGSSRAYYVKKALVFLLVFPASIDQKSLKAEDDDNSHHGKYQQGCADTYSKVLHQTDSRRI